MQTARIEISPVLGLDEKLPPSQNACTLLENFTVNKQTGAWDNRLGYEKYFSSKPKYGPFNDDEAIQSVYAWNTKGGAQQYVLYEATQQTTGATRLRVLTHNPPSATNLEVGRTKSTPNQTGTQYNPFGRYLIITNGEDGPWKYDGERLLPLGYTAQPGAPSPWRPDADHTQYSNRQFYPIVEQGDRELHVVYGLGRKTTDAWNVYRWKVAFLSESGSLSPLSEPSEACTWQTEPLAGTPTTWDMKRHAVHLENIPVGPTGTSGRILYRTLNLKDADTEDDQYYYVGTIYNNTETNYTDYVSDSGIGAAAPINGITFPSPSCRFSATFSGSLFVDGGLSQPTRIYYSDPGQPDSWSALNFFDVGNRSGGMVTALIPFQNNLVVFRERAIDLIKRDETSGDFYLKPLQEGIGTKAGRSISIIPQVGLAFLAIDGVWILQSDYQLIKISKPIISKPIISKSITETLDRMNIDLLPKACATYSKLWNEWHCYFAVDGSGANNFGIVYHFDNNSWSTRPNWPVSAVTTDTNGNIIFGHAIGKQTAVAAEDYEAGLFVISGIRTYGYNIILEQQEYITTPTAPDNAKFKTIWHDFGNPNLAKQVKHVYLYVLTSGNNEIPITYYKDYEFEGSSTSPTAKMQRAEYSDQNVFDTAVYDADTWEKPLLTEIRYDIAQKTCRHFNFEVETSEDFVFVGYAIELTSDKAKMRPGRGA